MQIIIFNPDKQVVLEIDRLTGNRPNITTICTGYAELHRSGLLHGAAVVSPGNGFGILDGGFDAALSAAHGPGLERAIKQAIIDQYGVELPVGAAIIVSVAGGAQVIYAPTMQGPMGIVGTDNAYRAARAAARLAMRDGIDTLYMPVLGAGTGALPLAAAVDQIVCGVHDGTYEMTTDEMTWAHADRMHLQWHRMCGVPDDNYRWSDEGVHHDDAVDDTPQN